jgi:hypothetical protein
MKITKSELRDLIKEVAEELGFIGEGLTKAQEKLPEPLKKAILKKQGNSEDSKDSKDSEEKEDVEEGLTKAQEKLPEPLKKAILKKQGKSDDSEEEEKIDEGNAFGAAVKAARENGEKEFEVGGKKYKLKEKKEVNEDIEEDTDEFVGEEDEGDVEEGNAFGAAVTKAKEEGEDEFEVDGKTYKVKESEESYDEDDVEEGNTFGAAVTKAKEDGDTEFEVGGKTYKVREGDWSRISLAEKLDRILGNKKIL